MEKSLKAGKRTTANKYSRLGAKLLTELRDAQKRQTQLEQALATTDSETAEELHLHHRLLDAMKETERIYEEIKRLPEGHLADIGVAFLKQQADFSHKGRDYVSQNDILRIGLQVIAKLKAQQGVKCTIGRAATEVRRKLVERQRNDYAKYPQKIQTIGRIRNIIGKYR